MRLRPLLAALLAVGLLVGACSQRDPSAQDVREDLASALQKGDHALTEDQAECYAKLIVDELGVKNVNDISFNAKAPNDEQAEQLAAVAQTARTRCKITS